MASVVQWDLRQDQVELLFRLEAELEWHDEWIVHTCKDEALGQRMGDFVPIHNVYLSDGLERVDTRCIALPDLEDLMGSGAE
jgi:hypothetical protein